MASLPSYRWRISRDELIIKCPNDEAHAAAIQFQIPESRYDSLIEEWRVPWEGGNAEAFVRDIASSVAGVDYQIPLGDNSYTVGKIFGYAQTYFGEGPEIQIDELRGFGIPDDQIYFDRILGRNPQCPNLEECLSKIEDGDILVVVKLSRFARSLKQLVERGESILSKNAHIKSLTEEVDTRTAEGRIFFEHVAVAAKFEGESNSERTKAGLKEARVVGRKGGRRGGLSENQIESIVKLTMDGVGVTEIAERIGTSRATIYRYFSGGPAGILEIFSKSGQAGVDEVIALAKQKISGRISEDKKEAILKLYNAGNTIDAISKMLGFTRDTVRAVIKATENALLT